MSIAKSPFDDNDGVAAPNRPPFVWGGNTDKLKEPNYGDDGGGNTTLISWDERELLSDTISATECCYAEPNSDPEWYGNRVGVYAERLQRGY